VYAERSLKDKSTPHTPKTKEGLKRASFNENETLKKS
jgi:hypothetical protein